MFYVNSLKNYRRELVKIFFDQGKNDQEVTYLSDYSESWVRQLQKAKLLSPSCRNQVVLFVLSPSNFEQLRQILKNMA